MPARPEPDAARTEAHTLVVALGGNAIARASDPPTFERRYQRAREALAEIPTLVDQGHRVVITHGNGPVVGALMLRGEIARETVSPDRLFIADADSEGEIGLILQQALYNMFAEVGREVSVATLITQVVVSESDPAFRSPDKPIGGWYEESEAHVLERVRGWTMRPMASGPPATPTHRYRRVVASPAPQRVVELAAIRTLLDSGHVVIAAGGGGVPVTTRSDGGLAAIDAVIDKDRASALLGISLNAGAFAIIMESDALYRDWGTSHQKALRRVTVSDAEAMLSGDELEAGSILPKLEAATRFTRHTRNTAVLCGSGDLMSALAGRSGTSVVWDTNQM